MSEGKSNLQERWIEAMNRVTCSLIMDGLTVKDALIVCRGCREDAPARPTLKRVNALEFEAQQVPPIPKYIRDALEDVENPVETIPNLPPLSVPVPPIVSTVQPKPKQIRREVRLDIEDYPEPWCKVTKDGKLVRYEDGIGQTVPKIFWPKEN